MICYQLKEELDSKLQCVGVDNGITPYYYNDLYNPGCCDGNKPINLNGVNYCREKPQPLPKAPFGYETIATNTKCSNWGSSWVDSASEPQFGADTVEKCAEACNRNDKCFEFYFHPTTKNCWLANGFCDNVPSDQTHFKSMKTIKDSLCYSNNQVLKYIRENLNDIEYDETETNNFLYEIQRDKGGFIKNLIITQKFMILEKLLI